MYLKTSISNIQEKVFKYKFVQTYKIVNRNTNNLKSI